MCQAETLITTASSLSETLVLCLLNLFFFVKFAKFRCLVQSDHKDDATVISVSS